MARPHDLQVPAALEGATKGSIVFRELLERLEQKLSVVLIPQGPEATPLKKLYTDGPGLCLVAAQIQEVADRLHDGNDILARLIESLQV